MGKEVQAAGDPAGAFHKGSRALQERFDTIRIADRIDQKWVSAVISPNDRAFIERADMFFLATADDQGRPSCSYKGGDPGFVRVVDDRTIAFPIYDGNGMYFSAGNILVNPEVGLLFIDFEQGHRTRLEGSATIDEHDELMALYPEAQFIVRVRARRVFPNCPRYIHTYRLVERSKFVPHARCETPVPDWKRDEWARDFLPANDPARSLNAVDGQEEAEMNSDVESLHRRACEAVTFRVKQIGDDQWGLPTPCSEWDVRALVAHLVSGTAWVAPLVEGQTIEQVGDRFGRDLLGDDPAQVWRNAAAETVAACAAEGATSRTVHLSSGESPAEDYLKERIADLVLHAWDLSKAIRADDQIDSDLVDSALQTYLAVGDMYRQYGALAPRVQIPEGSDALTQLLAESGRDPNWAA